MGIQIHCSCGKTLGEGRAHDCSSERSADFSGFIVLAGAAAFILHVLGVL